MHSNIVRLWKMRQRIVKLSSASGLLNCCIETNFRHTITHSTFLLHLIIKICRHPAPFYVSNLRKSLNCSSLIWLALQREMEVCTMHLFNLSPATNKMTKKSCKASKFLAAVVNTFVVDVFFISFWILTCFYHSF